MTVYRQRDVLTVYLRYVRRNRHGLVWEGEEKEVNLRAAGQNFAIPDCAAGLWGSQNCSYVSMECSRGAPIL